MGIGTSDGKYYEDEFEQLVDVAPGRPRVYINTGDVEDRRGEPNPNAPAWESVVPSLKDIIFKAFVGPPMADEVPPGPLSKEAGFDDVKNEKIVPQRSLLDRAFDDVSDGAQFFYNISRALQGKEPVKLGMDTPLSQIPFSEGMSKKMEDPIAPRMPLGGSTEPADALFSTGGTQTPENTSREEIRPTPDYMNPPENVGSFRPRASSIIKDFVTGIVDGIKLFSGKEPTWAIDPVSGEVRTDPRVIEKVMHAGELATFGPGVIAGKAADGTLGSFIGAKAKTWDKNSYALANIMEKQGKSSDEILQKTGMFRGVDKKWRTEISDSDAYIDPDWASSIGTKPTRHQLEEAVRDMARKEYAKRGDRFATKEELQMYMDDPLAMYDVFDKKDFEKYFPGWKFDRNLEMTRTGRSIAKLGDVYDHPELYKNYPELKDLPFIEDPNYKGIAEAGIEGEYIKYNRQNLEDAGYDLKSVLIHEVQHVLQQKEGFAKGGGPIEVARGLYKLKHQLTDAQLKEADNIIKGLVEKFKEQGLDEAEFQTLIRLEKIISTHAKYIKAADEQARENYMRLAGEVEARNAASRQDIIPEDLRRYNPYDSQDTYSYNQIVQTDVPPGMTAYGILLDDGTSLPVPRPQMADIQALRRAANDNQIKKGQVLPIGDFRLTRGINGDYAAREGVGAYDTWPIRLTEEDALRLTRLAGEGKLKDSYKILEKNIKEQGLEEQLKFLQGLAEGYGLKE